MVIAPRTMPIPTTPAMARPGMRHAPRSADRPGDLLGAEDIPIPVDRLVATIDDEVGRHGTAHGSAKSTTTGAWSEGMPG